MIGAAYAKALFGQVEWWLFFMTGLGWLTWMATHFRKTHEFGFLWKENRLLSENFRKTAESYMGGLKNLDALLEKKVARHQGSALGPAPSFDPDQKNNPDDGGADNKGDL